MRAAWMCCVGLVVLCSWSHTMAAGTFYVDGGHPSCSNSGPGTQTTPYCTVSAAQTARGGPGTTILIEPGTYREVITVSNSGSSGNPFVIKADSGPVVIEGADDFSTPAQWVKISGTVYRAASVTWTPLQVFSDGARLTASTVTPPSAIPPGTFEFVSGQGLYVNVGAGNPGDHTLLVGRRAYGFRIPGTSWIDIDGLTILHTEDRGVYVTGPSSYCEISNSTISYANSNGIAMSGASFMTVRANTISFCNDHGIFLTGNTTGSTIEGNASFQNARPSVRAANGINLTSSPNNVVQRNLLHDNQDSGLQFGSNANNNRSLQNRSWNNGDHGFDHLNSTGTVHIGDVAYGNFKDGFSIEGSCSNTTVVDSIAIDNGLTTGEFDFWCDTSSSTGLVSNHNIFWNSTSQEPIKFMLTRYATVSSFCAATGHDCLSEQADPLFASAASGDFHVLSGSPAIDSGDSSVAHWPATDASGLPRIDDQTVPNSGLGPIHYADVGALEFAPACDGQVGQPCGSSSVGDCSFGTTQCSAVTPGVLECAGNIEPSEEVCDGRDNDCDGTIDSGGSSMGTPLLMLTHPSATVQLAWSAVTGSSTYDVVRGDLSALESSGGDFTSTTRACLANDISARQLNDGTPPGAGLGFWYLVRGTNACSDGTYDEDGSAQIGLRDAEIDASPLACP